MTEKNKKKRFEQTPLNKLVSIAAADKNNNFLYTPYQLHAPYQLPGVIKNKSAFSVSAGLPSAESATPPSDESVKIPLLNYTEDKEKLFKMINISLHNYSNNTNNIRNAHEKAHREFKSQCSILGCDMTGNPYVDYFRYSMAFADHFLGAWNSLAESWNLGKTPAILKEVNVDNKSFFKTIEK
jgi:hypothetical protein